jgi:hypothetical protein
MTGVLMTVRKLRAREYSKRLKAQRAKPVALADVAAPTRKEGAEVVRIADGLAVTLEEVTLTHFDEHGKAVNQQATTRRVQAPVEWLVSRGLLSQEQARAGRWLHEVYALGVCGARSADRASTGTSKQFGLSDAQLISLADYRRVMSKASPEQRGVLIRCICWDMAVGKVAERTSTPKAEVIAILRDSLDMVAEWIDG